MFPEIDIDMEIEVDDIDDEETPSEDVTALGRVPLYDFDKRSYVIKDGKVVEATEDEAIRQWVAFLILTKRDKYDVYEGTDFGTYVENYIGWRGSNPGFVASELKREIKEGCEAHPLIEEIDDFKLAFENGLGHVSLTVIKKDGSEVEVSEDVAG